MGQRYSEDHPMEWIGFARSDLELARPQERNIHIELLCFHAQQAVEKALKAVMVDRMIDFPYTHDIGELLTILEENGIEYTVATPEVNRLSRYATVTRYPGPSDPPTPTDHARALEVAEQVVEWAEGQIRRRDQILN